MKYLTLILMLVLSSCSKQFDGFNQKMSFNLNNNYYFYNRVIIDSFYFCGEKNYTIIGNIDEKNSFQIVITNINLHKGKYDAVANLWGESMSGISQDLKIEILNINSFEARFSGSIIYFGKNYSLTNGHVIK